MTIESKLVALAAADPTLQSLFGTSPMRLFDRQLPQTYYSQGLCCSFRRVSEVRTYTQFGLMNLSQPRIQFDIRASPRYVNGAAEAARAAADALIAWLGTVSFAESNDFGTPPHSPIFVLNQRAGMDFQLEPPVYVETIDVRIFNLEDSLMNVFQVAQVTLTSAEILALTGTNGALIAPGVSGKTIVPITAYLQYLFGTVPYTLDTNGALFMGPLGNMPALYDTQAISAGTPILLAVSSRDTVMNVIGIPIPPGKGQAYALFYYDSTGSTPIAAGDGTLTITFLYYLM